MADAETRLLIEQLIAAGDKLQAEVWATYGPLPRVEPLYEEWHKATDELDALLQSVRSVTPQEPNSEVCVVCRIDYDPKGGQRAGVPWGIWGKGWRVCKWCVQAGRDEKRKRERAAN
jgi:hypothetical protein